MKNLKGDTQSEARHGQHAAVRRVLFLHSEKRARKGALARRLVPAGKHGEKLAATRDDENKRERKMPLLGRC